QGVHGVRLLLDSHALLWFVWNHPKLSATAQAAIADPTNELLLSPVSFWEIALKVSLNKLTLAMPYHDFMDQVIADLKLSLLPIEIRHTARVVTLPFHHKDPFDRLLLAQALVEDIPLVSNEALFDSYGVRRLW